MSANSIANGNAIDYVNDELALMTDDDKTWTTAQVTDVLANVARLLNGLPIDGRGPTVAHAGLGFHRLGHMFLQTETPPVHDAKAAAALAIRRDERAGLRSCNPETEFALGYARGAQEAVAESRVSLPWSDPESDPVGDLKAMYPALIRGRHAAVSDE